MRLDIHAEIPRRRRRRVNKRGNLCNTEELWRNLCCREKIISNTYSECASVASSL
jgi:hypothetical protein